MSIYFNSIQKIVFLKYYDFKKAVRYLIEYDYDIEDSIEDIIEDCEVSYGEIEC